MTDINGITNLLMGLRYPFTVFALCVIIGAMVFLGKVWIEAISRSPDTAGELQTVGYIFYAALELSALLCLFLIGFKL